MTSLTPETPPWKAQALASLAELREEILEAGDPGALWVEIWLAFDGAYDEPQRPDLIRRIYEYAWWCLETNEPDNLASCVCVALLEHIPDNPAARAEMPRWFTREEVLTMRDIFSYLIGPAEYDRLLELFPAERSNRAARRLERKKSYQSRPWAQPDHPANRPSRKP